MTIATLTPRTAALEVARQAAPVDLIGYALAMLPQYQIGRHHELIADHLMAVERGEIKRLMIFMPPRHGKSQLASELFPAWYLGRNPNRRVMGTSYGDRLAQRFSRRVRNQIMGAHYPFPGVEIAGDKAAVAAWDIEAHTGGYWAAGVGSAVTGEGAHLLIIDDPVKNRAQADSPTYRDRVWDWYQNDAYTRLMPGAAVVVIQTRWHEDDLSGRLLDAQEHGGDEWTVLSLPARAEDADDPLGRATGAALWPEWYDEEDLSRIEANVGPRGWDALYQQRPSALEGSVFLREWMGGAGRSFDDMDQLVRDVGVPRRLIQVVDSAFKEGVGRSYSVVATWADFDGRYLLLDLWRDRVEYPDLIEAIKNAWVKWGNYRPVVYIEDKASGQSALQTLRRERVLLGGRPTTIPVKAWLPPTHSSKESRADAVTPAFREGEVWLPRAATWLADWIEEHVTFPTGAHDDQVDTTSMALSILWLGRRMKAEAGNKKTTDRRQKRLENVRSREF